MYKNLFVFLNEFAQHKSEQIHLKTSKSGSNSDSTKCVIYI